MTTDEATVSTPEQQWASILGRWRAWLDHDTQRGARAELKRCSQLTAVLCHPAALRLHSQLQDHPWRTCTETVGVLAGVAPWLRRLPEEKEPAKDPELPWILGQSVHGERPRFSELRFKRLLESRDSDDLLQQLRRALAQTDGAGNWLHLADTINRCHRQWANPERYSGSRQWQFRWSQTYYNEVFKYLKEAKA
jgi:CRISPR system Cascade subunit CasB